MTARHGVQHPAAQLLHQVRAFGGIDDFPNFRLEYLAALLAAYIAPDG
jgi:hypothetical protein